MALKNLTKIPKEWGIYSPKTKLAVRLIFQPVTAGGRPPDRPPTVKNMTVGGTRSTAQKQRAKLSGRSTAPVDRALCLANVHKSVHIGRPTLGYGRPARSTARACQALFWVRKQGLKIL